VAAASAVVARSIGALGTPQAVAAVRSVRGLARCRGPRGEYLTFVDSARGDLLRFEQRWPDGRRFLAFVRGAEAWAHDFDTGLAEPISPEMRAAIRSHEFQLIPLVLAERYSPQSVIQEDDSTRVAVLDELGLPGELRFDARTGLLLSMAFTNYNRPAEQVITTLGPWRSIDGVLFPERAVATDSTGDYVLDFHTIEVNPFAEPEFAVRPE
jgi:hypothetical protein